MTEKIDHLTTTQQIRAMKQSQAPVAGQDSAPDSGAVSSDSVHLTADAMRLQAAQQQVSNAPDVDLKKVEAVREALAAGDYKIDSAGIAERMTAIETLLGPNK